MRAYNKESTFIKPKAEAVLLPANKSITCEFQEKVKFIIRNHLSDSDFGVKELADKLFMSRSTLHRKLRQQHNITASDLITKLRLERSKELLKTNLSLLEIAYEIGLSSHSYFNKKFVREFELKPRDYRKKL